MYDIIAASIGHCDYKRAPSAPQANRRVTAAVAKVMQFLRRSPRCGVTCVRLEVLFKDEQREDAARDERERRNPRTRRTPSRTKMASVAQFKALFTHVCGHLTPCSDSDRAAIHRSSCGSESKHRNFSSTSTATEGKRMSHAQINAGIIHAPHRAPPRKQTFTVNERCVTDSLKFLHTVISPQTHTSQLRRVQTTSAAHSSLKTCDFFFNHTFVTRHVAGSTIKSVKTDM